MRNSKTKGDERKRVLDLQSVATSNQQGFTHLVDIKQELINVLLLELSSIQYVINHFPQNAITLVEKIASTVGKIILAGTGKSGLVAKKLSATFSSLGTPAIFLHPHDALHGDLGVIQEQDLVIMFSKSASGIEFEHLISFLNYRNQDNILICCDNGPLVSKAHFVVSLPFQREACTLNLAPTSSSTLMMAFGDALAIAVSKIKTFTKHDFARVHPAGALGKKLQQKVTHFMHVGLGLPLLSTELLFSQALEVMNLKKLGLGIVVDDQNSLLGIITDGDIRRLCSQGPSIFTKTVGNIMTTTTKTITSTTFAGDALAFMEDFNITSLIVTQEKQVIGLVHIHDLIKAGLKS